MHSFGVQVKSSAPIFEDQAFPIELNPSSVRSNESGSLFGNSADDTNCFLKRPSEIEAGANTLIGYVKSFSPFNKAKALTVVGDAVVCAPVSLLFCFGSPLAVGLVVSRIVVNTLYRGVFWRYPHVAKEVVEHKPRIVNGYSSASVITKRLVVRVRTSLNNSIPNAIGASLFASRVMGKSLLSWAFNAPAGFCCSVSKTLRFTNNLFSAIAPNKPLFSGFWSNRYKGTKTHTSYVLCLRGVVTRLAAIGAFPHVERLSRKFNMAIRACLCNEGHRIILRKTHYTFQRCDYAN